MRDKIIISLGKKSGEKHSIIRFVVAVLFVFTLLYQPPMPVSVIYVLTFISIGYLVLSIHLNYAEYIKILLAFLGMFAILLLIILLNGNQLANISHYFWLLACIIPAAIAFSQYVNKTEKSFAYLFHVLLCAAVLQAILAYMCLFSEEIHETFFEYMLRTGLYTESHLEKWGYRIYGYGNSLMYAIPVIQGLIAAWAFLYGVDKSKLIYSILGVLVLVSAIISAKIAFVVFVTTVLLGLIIGFKHYSKKLLRIAVVVLIATGILLYAYSYAQNNHGKLAEWVSLLFQEDGITGYTDYYTNANKWELPDGLAFFFGTGENRPNYDVDMGIVNDVWLGGILYLGFTVGVVLTLAYRIRKNPLFPALWQKIMASSLVIAFFIADIKGTAFHYSAFMAFFILIALFSGNNGHVTKNTGLAAK